MIYTLLEAAKDMAKTVCRLCKEVDTRPCTGCDEMDRWQAAIAEAEKEE